MNILISVNNKYLDKAETMLFSLQLAVKDKIQVYFINHSVSDKELFDFRQYLLSNCRNITLNLVDITNTPLDQLPIGKMHFSIEMYYRILAQFLLPSSIDRILWLDADIVVRKDISTFYNQQFDGMKYIVCPDSRPMSKSVTECKKNLSLGNDDIYFNSGVMLMNLDLLRKETNMQNIINTCYRMQDLVTYPDQDILNYMYVGQVKFADWKKYNFQLNGINTLEKKMIEDIYILHFAGPEKPWNYWHINGGSKYWWSFRIKQGKRPEAIKAYLLKFIDMTAIYFREIKNVFF